MAAPKTRYVCSQCGTEHLKWQGRCTGCGQWNTLAEERAPAKATSRAYLPGSGMPHRLAELPAHDEPRLPLPDAELNRVLDGGLVPASVILLGGEPGIGKSTLMLQLALQWAEQPILYVTGEESERQVSLRAQRLGPVHPNLWLLAETRVQTILAAAEQIRPTLLLIDSIQTLMVDGLESAPGSVAQVRESASALQRLAKNQGPAVVLVGHVTKDGMLAGPKVLEHLVDVVLEFEGDSHHGYRLVRSVKNRYGATPALGVYEMHSQGLRPVANPSALFMGNGTPAAGVAIAAVLPGGRPLLVEVQALVSPAAYGTPQRNATGVDARRLHMLLAILEKKAGLRLSNQDVFVNLAGGLRLDDPSLDLALCAAVVSAYLDLPLSPRTVYCAEVGLTGEVRAAHRLLPRLQEAARLGFSQLHTGPTPEAQHPEAAALMQVHTHATLAEWLRTVGPDLHK